MVRQVEAEEYGTYLHSDLASYWTMWSNHRHQYSICALTVLLPGRHLPQIQ